MSEHTVKSFDDELSYLANLIARMGGLAEAQLDGALQALQTRDSDLANKVIELDKKVDELEQEVHSHTTRMLALRQPLAQDLRYIVGAIKVAGDLERIADYAANAAKRTLIINQIYPVRFISGLIRLGRIVQERVKNILDAYLHQDVKIASSIWIQDEQLEAIHNGLFQELVLFMMEDARNITPCIHLMFIAKNIERVGDHIAHIAETVYFLVNGTSIQDDMTQSGDKIES
jgi:phosphate transport system protein